MEQVQNRLIDIQFTEELDFRPQNSHLLAFRMEQPSYRFVYLLNQLFHLNLQRQPKQLPVPFREAREKNSDILPKVEASFYYKYNSFLRVHFILLQLPPITEPKDNISGFFNTFLFVNGINARAIRNYWLEALGSNSVHHFDPNDLQAARIEPLIQTLRSKFIVEAHSFDFDTSGTKTSFFGTADGIPPLRKHIQFTERVRLQCRDMLYVVEQIIQNGTIPRATNKDIEQWDKGEEFSCDFRVYRK